MLGEEGGGTEAISHIAVSDRLSLGGLVQTDTGKMCCIALMGDSTLDWSLGGILSSSFVNPNPVRWTEGHASLFIANQLSPFSTLIFDCS